MTMNSIDDLIQFLEHQSNMWKAEAKKFKVGGLRRARCLTRSQMLEIILRKAQELKANMEANLKIDDMIKTKEGKIGKIIWIYDDSLNAWVECLSDEKTN